MNDSPPDLDAWHTAVSLEERGEHQAALAAFEALLSSAHLDRGRVRFHCGWNGELAGLIQAAVEHYEHAARFATPEIRLHALFRIGSIQRQRGNHADALCCFERAHGVAEVGQITHPLAHHVAYWFGLSLEEEGRYLEALTRYRKAAALAALRDEAGYRAIQCLVAVGRYEQAVSECKAFLAYAPAESTSTRTRELVVCVQNEKLSLEKSLQHA